jgi:hypothetical protein
MEPSAAHFDSMGFDCSFGPNRDPRSVFSLLGTNSSFSDLLQVTQFRPTQAKEWISMVLRESGSVVVGADDAHTRESVLHSFALGDSATPTMVWASVGIAFSTIVLGTAGVFVLVRRRFRPSGLPSEEEMTETGRGADTVPYIWSTPNDLDDIEDKALSDNGRSPGQAPWMYDPEEDLGTSAQNERAIAIVQQSVSSV